MAEDCPQPDRPWCVVAQDVERGHSRRHRMIGLGVHHGAFSSRSTDWKPLYEAALLETDAGKLPERITVARSAIFDRIEESLTHTLPGEQRAMDEALRNLRRLATLTAKSAA